MFYPFCLHLTEFCVRDFINPVHTKRLSSSGQIRGEVQMSRSLIFAIFATALIAFAAAFLPAKMSFEPRPVFVVLCATATFLSAYTRLWPQLLIGFAAALLILELNFFLGKNIEGSVLPYGFALMFGLITRRIANGPL